MTEAEDLVRRAFKEWEEARGAEDKLRDQFVTVGTLSPGERIRRPPRVFDVVGVQELQEAERRTHEKWDAYQDAVGRWKSDG